MRRAVGPELGVKAAGGIRNLEDARAMVAAGATRIGASASVKIKESHEQARPMIHLDPRHKLTQEFVALFDALA